MKGGGLHKALLHMLAFGMSAALAAGSAHAQSESAPPATALETPAEAIAQDAAEYAARQSVSLDEALRRLRFQEASIGKTDALRAEFKDRFAGLVIEHQPDYRVIVLLTGTDWVQDRFMAAGGAIVPVSFHTGAVATHDQLVAALDHHQMELRAALADPQGMGVDPKTGEIVVLTPAAGMNAEALVAKQQELTAIAGVPIRIRLINREDGNLAVEGGSRVVGVDPRDGHRHSCTTGFVVTDASRTGIITAAHCPDDMTYFGPDGVQVPLSFVGEWGALTRDVQVHVTEAAQKPEFYVDKDRRTTRPLTSARTRSSTRVGDIVCHRGESSGYSCSTIELVDFAPPGTLCGGPCEPVWVTVAGPSCQGGDSGGPIFAGTTAFGIVKGASYKKSGECNFYFYMSVDYLPDGWSLLLQR
jgi:streptogrisin C